MASSNNFGRLCRDLLGGGLQIKSQRVLDQHANLSVRDANIQGNLLVNGTLVRGDLIVSGDVLGSEPQSRTRLAARTTLVTGNLCSARDEFVETFTFQGNTRVWIEPLPASDGFQPMSVMLCKLPCNGVVQVVDSATGNILYQPSSSAFAETGIDVLQYTILDECNVRHKVTQLICRQMLPVVPPFLLSACITFLGGAAFFPRTIFSGQWEANGFALQGTYRLDWTTFVIKSMDAYSSAFFGTGPLPPISSFPFPFNSAPNLVGPGIQASYNTLEWFGAGPDAGKTMTFRLEVDPFGVFTDYWTSAPSNPTSGGLRLIVRVMFELRDIEGNFSNCPPFYWVSGSSSSPAV